ncbi:MAG: flagellin [Planctomycetota bacterium]
MALIINHNISAMNTQRNLERTSRNLAKSLQKLSSGYKINVAADDPSGLIISEQLRSQTSGLERAIRNSQEAFNVIGIAEGALIEINEILRTLRGLALHAANSGITASDQIRADQAEVDSAIQTIDRIANTTKYSDQFLLNGSKGLVYSRTTVVDDSMDLALLNIDQTRIDQIFKRAGVSMDISFNGRLTSSQPDYAQETRRAYFEADDNNTSADIGGNEVSADQRFIITGNNGARAFSFAAQTNLGSIASAIDNLKDSTGVGCQLILASNVAPADSTLAALDLSASTTRAAGGVEVYAANLDDDDATNDKILGADIRGTDALSNTRFLVGKNTDGQGRLYVKVTRIYDSWDSVGGAAGADGTDDSVDFEVYKDTDLTMLVGSGSSVQSATGGANPSLDPADYTLNFSPANASGLSADDVLLALNASQVALDDVVIIGATGQEFGNADDGMDYSSLALAGFNDGVNTPDAASILSGVNLGTNTDMGGNLYFRASGAAASRTIEVFKDASMASADLVASGTADLSAGGSIRLEAENDSGLYLTLTFGGAASAGAETGTLTFDQLGLRLYSVEYGSSQYIRLQNKEGSLWGYYSSPAENSFTFVTEGQTIQENGADATVTLNGMRLTSNGLTATVATPDISGSLVFQEGTLGAARIAQAGYDVGSLYSRATALQAVEDEATPTLINTFTYATNARHVTTETLSNFLGGMQYQLSENDGDQARTVYAIPSMAVPDLGQIILDGTTYTLQDVLGGGEASLAKDPVKAMKIISKAVDDVSSLRARLGAFQKNMLQTNINSLDVTVENIVQTESAIRDANMAAETTEFTKNQIMVQAGTSMLAQANVVSQSVLKLLE